ncbi:Golgi membrane exchange factor (Ric1p-Rgp1p) subunit [Mycoemilia scoparia]|uniref:Golgi membrane exchange factor (Ric1p-Rgp1p) subunit n=1 Tax=Mycoemilia scoparia TaxID=417184 RepID=A0A9W8A9X8_9FUNG|nr:Golgi membrane exchange factor (Ric1p-Rgp1p) subunit [Mycoemilia scoparia]
MTGLTVTTSLDKDGAYYAGEIITCHVTFRNTHPTTYATHPPSPHTPRFKDENARTAPSPTRSEFPKPYTVSPRVSVAPLNSSPLNPHSRNPSTFTPPPPLPPQNGDRHFLDASRRRLTHSSQIDSHSSNLGETQGHSPSRDSQRMRRSAHATSFSGGIPGPEACGTFPASKPRVNGFGEVPSHPRDNDTIQGYPSAPNTLNHYDSDQVSISSINTRPGIDISSPRFGNKPTTLNKTTNTDGALNEKIPNGQPQNKNITKPNERKPSNSSLVSYLSGFIKSFNEPSDDIPTRKPFTTPVGLDEASAEQEEYIALGVAKLKGTLSVVNSFFSADAISELLDPKSHQQKPNLSGKNGRVPIGGGMQGWIPSDNALASNQPAYRNRADIKHKSICETQPAIMCSDLHLLPGKSEVYKLEIELPKSLPPLFRGKATKISYEIVIVVRRNMLDQVSHVIRLPVRIMPYITPKGTTYPFNPWRPINNFKSPAITTVNLVDNHKNDTLQLENLEISSNSDHASLTTIEEKLRASDFFSKVLKSSDVINSGLLSSKNSSGNVHRSREKEAVRNSINDICRMRSPITFSLSHQNTRIATVWLPNKNYQIGQEIQGKIDFHTSSLACHRVSVWLESTEIPGANYKPRYSGLSPQWSRKVHAEYHESCRSLDRVGFSLPTSPTTSFPSFDATLFSNVWQLRIEILVSDSNGDDTSLSLDSVTSDLVLNSRALFPPIQSPQMPQPTRHRLSISFGSNPYSALTSLRPPINRIQQPPLHSTHVNPATSSESSPQRGRTRARGQSFLGVFSATSSSTQNSWSTSLGPTIPPIRHSMSNDSESVKTERRSYGLPPTVKLQLLSCNVPLQMYPPSMVLPLSRTTNSSGSGGNGSNNLPTSSRINTKTANQTANSSSLHNSTHHHFNNDHKTNFEATI